MSNGSLRRPLPAKGRRRRGLACVASAATHNFEERACLMELGLESAREMCSSGWIPLIAYAWRFIRDLPLSMKSCLGEPMLSSGGLRSGKQNGRHLNPRGCPKDSCLRVCPNGLLTCVPLEDC